MLCGPDLACDTATGTCVCGDRAQPCCAGTTCDGNLTCSAGACTCGAIGDPCCDGTTCNAGATCAGGTCDGGVVQVAVGKGTVCAVRTDHTVWCWGSDAKAYAAGTPGMAVPVIHSVVPQRVVGLTDVEEVHGSGFFMCARKTDKSIWCWGHNELGQLGDGSHTSTAVPVQVAGLSNVSTFDVGWAHACAIGTVSEKSTLWCWGRNGVAGHRAMHMPTPNAGRLGNGSLIDSAVPVAVDLSAAAASGQSVRSLSVGGYHTCIAMSDSRVWCWGENKFGALGTGTTTSASSPVEVDRTAVTVPPGVTVDQVSCSSGYGETTCMRLSNGSVYCWGQGAHGQLGDGTTDATRLSPTTPIDASALGSAKLTSLSATADSFCGIASDGAVWCWGGNQGGVIGNNNPMTKAPIASYSTPVQALGLSGITLLGSGHHTACAVDGANRLFCWGNNRRGQVSTSVPATKAEAQVLTPVEVSL